MRETKDKQTSPAVIGIALVLMAGFFAWLLLQMGPHGPEGGELLISLIVGLVGTLLGVAVLMALFALARRVRAGRDH